MNTYEASTNNGKKIYQVHRQAGGITYLANEAEIKLITPDEFHSGLEFFFRNSKPGDVFDHAPGSYHYVVAMGRLFTGKAITPYDVSAVRNLAGCSMLAAREALIETSGDVEQAALWLTTRGLA